MCYVIFSYVLGNYLSPDYNTFSLTCHLLCSYSACLLKPMSQAQHRE